MITSCLYQFYNMAWWYSSVVIAYTKYFDIIIHPVPFNPLQSHSAEHFACQSSTTSCQFLQRLKSLNERGRRHNINEIFHIMALWFWVALA